MENEFSWCWHNYSIAISLCNHIISQNVPSMPKQRNPQGQAACFCIHCAFALRHSDNKSDGIHAPVSAKTTSVASHLSNARGVRGRTLPSICCQCSICASDSGEKWLFVWKRGGVDHSVYLSLSMERSGSIYSTLRTCHCNSEGFTIFHKVKVSVVRNRRITGTYSLE